MEAFQRPDGGEGDRQGEPMAEELRPRVDGGDVPQDPGLEGDAIERLAIARHRGLGLRGADQIAPGVAVEPGFRVHDELVERLIAFGQVVLQGAPPSCLGVSLAARPERETGAIRTIGLGRCRVTAIAG